MKRLILASIFLVVSLPIFGNVFLETHLIEVNLHDLDPDYDERVQYRLYLEGLGTYRVKLQKWKFISLGKGMSELRFQEEFVLFENIPVAIELHEIDPRWDLATIETIAGRSNEGALQFRKSIETDTPRYGSQKLTIKSSALANIFPTHVKEKVFLPNQIWLKTKNKRYGKFAASIDNARHFSHTTGRGPEGDEPKLIEWTKLGVFGNGVRAVKIDGWPVAEGTIDFDKLESRGYAELTLDGNHRNSVIELLGESEKVLFTARLDGGSCASAWE